jgi:hypothetical protein
MASIGDFFYFEMDGDASAWWHEDMQWGFEE